MIGTVVAIHHDVSTSCSPSAAGRRSSRGERDDERSGEDAAEFVVEVGIESFEHDSSGQSDLFDP
jgi:hypothetical protein